MMTKNIYQQATFLKSAAELSQLPPDEGYEIAFVGRSNAGKSSAINCLTGQRQLARTSKTPGRTQLINLFTLDEERRLVDLPGYGYAKVAQRIKEVWQKSMMNYLEKRQSLQGLVLLADSRHPLKDSDRSMLSWALARPLPVHILLTKVDKISYRETKANLLAVEKDYQDFLNYISVQGFSALNKQGLEQLIGQLNTWLHMND